MTSYCYGEGIAAPNATSMQENLKAVSLPAQSRKQSDSDQSEIRRCTQDMSEAEVAAMRDLAIAASEKVNNIPCTPIRKHHHKTGRIRMPREHSDSEYTSDDDSEATEEPVSAQDRSSTPRSQRKRVFPKATASSSTSASSSSAAGSPRAHGRWSRTSTGKYAINPVKCPPCARRKKADKCRGGPPCRECWSRGRKTAALCQEWGDGWESKK